MLEYFLQIVLTTAEARSRTVHCSAASAGMEGSQRRLATTQERMEGTSWCSCHGERRKGAGNERRDQGKEEEKGRERGQKKVNEGLIEQKHFEKHFRERERDKNARDAHME